MKVVQPFELNDATLKDHVLIATQGSTFKDSVVSEVITELESTNVYIRVIDVTVLPEIVESEWNAIIILHTWENWKPQKDAKFFIEQLKNKRKLIVLCTSGSGESQIEGVDGLSSASQLSDARPKAKEITARVKKLLNATED